MSNFVGTIGIVAIAAGVSIATKPSASDLEAYILDQLQTQMANPSYNGGDDAVSALIKLTCQFNSQDCAHGLRALMNVQIEDYAVGQVAAIFMGNSREPALVCFGAFTNWWCTDPPEEKA
ncbi:MAG: hypothetical protein ACP5DX_17065 [Paracoccaceae bacterium]